MIQAAKARTLLFLLAAVCLPAFANIPRTPLVAEKPHLGSADFALTLHRAESAVNAVNTQRLPGCLYDSCVQPCSSGKERDAETGLDFMEARYFSGAQGRFTSPDEPLAFADFANPQSWNLYSYGYNNPLLYSDPDGHEPCENGVNPENGNFCVVGTAKKPEVETKSSPIGPLVIPLLVTTVQISQKTQELAQPIVDWFSRPRNPICTAGYTALGGSIGFWAGGGLGTLGLAGGPTAAATIPGGAGGGAALGGAIGGFGGLVLCSTGSGTGGGGGAASQSSGDGFWKGLRPFRGKTKTNGLQGKNKRFFEWDHTHGDVEVYDGRGRHLGSADPATGTMTKPAVPGRSITI